MDFFSGSASPSQLGKVDRWIVRYLMVCSVIFAATYIGQYCYRWYAGVGDATMLMAGILLLKAISLPAPHGGYRGRAALILSLLFVVALFNSTLSWDQMESSLRWVLWMGIVFCFSRVVGASDGTWMEVIIQRLPQMFTFLYVTVVISGHYSQDNNSLRFALHLSGLYGNLVLATGLFSNKLWQRVLWCSVGLVAIFFSGAGGALFTIPIMFVPYILYSASSMPVKGIAVAGLLMFGGLFFFESQLFSRFLDIKLSITPAEEGSYSGLDRLERSKDARLQLVQYGLQLAEQNPLGTGLGHTYKQMISGEMGVDHVHNGTLTMIIELGFPCFTVVACLLLWIFVSIFQANQLSHQIKAFYFTYFFTIFGRSLSENYTPFDLGNFFNFIFLIFTVSLFLYQHSSAPAQPRMGRPEYRPGQMMPPPRWAMPPGARPPSRPMPVH